MTRNPIPLNIAAFSAFDFACTANTDYIQRVAILILDESGNKLDVFIFSGNGINVPMKLEDGNITKPLPKETYNRVAFLTFEWSKSGPGGPFLKSNVSDPIKPAFDWGWVATISSHGDDDLSDKNYNEAVVTAVARYS